MISPRFCQATVPWKTTATQTRASGENRVSTKLGVFQFVVVAAGRVPFRTEDLLAAAALVAMVRGGRPGAAGSVKGILS